jgi:hypothetical protein
MAIVAHRHGDEAPSILHLARAVARQNWQAASLLLACVSMFGGIALVRQVRIQVHRVISPSSVPLHTAKQYQQHSRPTPRSYHMLSSGSAAGLLHLSSSPSRARAHQCSQHHQRLTSSVSSPWMKMRNSEVPSLLSPYSLSTNTMGTSVIVKPQYWALTMTSIWKA